VFKNLDFLGWYTTGSEPTENDIKVHKQVCLYSLCRRHTCNPTMVYTILLSSIKIFVLVPQRSHWITKSTFQISFNLIGQSNNAFFNRPTMACVYSSNPGTQLGAKNKDFCARPQTNLTRSLVLSVVQSSFVKMIYCWPYEVIMFLLSQTLWNVIPL